MEWLWGWCDDDFCIGGVFLVCFYVVIEFVGVCYFVVEIFFLVVGVVG